MSDLIKTMDEICLSCYPCDKTKKVIFVSELQSKIKELQKKSHKKGFNYGYGYEDALSKILSLLEGNK
jgi:hypothetical protein